MKLRLNFATSLCFFILTSFSVVKAQTDTIIGYDFDTNSTFSIAPVSFNTTVQADSTTSFIGSLRGFVDLPLNPPTTNLFQGSSFSKLAKADQFFNLNDYPVRTAVKIVFYYGGLEKKCSGILTGPSSVLTAAHCTCDWINQKWGANNVTYDSIFVFPGFNNGQVNAIIGKSKVKKIYAFKKFYDNKAWEDISVLELYQPLGLQAGWVGIAFNSNDNYFQNRVLHKLSYPAKVNISNPLEVYNGDTLYYNYGYTDLPASLGVNSPSAIGVQGQSGSSLFHTNNITGCYSFGVFNFSTNYKHYRIKASSFYQLKNLLDNYVTSINESKENPLTLQFYPNPASDHIFIDIEKNCSLQIFNSSGTLLFQTNLNKGRNEIGLKQYEPGLYLARVSHLNGANKTFRFIKSD